MKLRVGYISCNEAPAEGSLDSTLLSVMNCNSYTNGGGYYDGGVIIQPDPVYYPKDPILPPALPADEPSETLTPVPIEPPAMEVQTAIDTTPEETKPIPPALIIGGGLLLLFFLGKNKRKR
jgi:hypothetical protein